MKDGIYVMGQLTGASSSQTQVFHLTSLILYSFKQRLALTLEAIDKSLKSFTLVLDLRARSSLCAQDYGQLIDLFPCLAELDAERRCHLKQLISSVPRVTVTTTTPLHFWL